MSTEFLGGDQPSESVAESQPASAATESQAKPEYSEFLQAITNAEGKPKYKTVADALIGAAKAQEHIANLEAENRDLRGLKTKVETMEQVLQRLGESRTADPQTKPTIEDPESLVETVLDKRERVRAERDNRKQVLSALNSKFGEKTDAMLKTKADELGLTVQELGAMAARSPKAVLTLFNAEVKGTPTVQGTVNTEALTPRSTEVKVPENIMWGANTKQLTDFFKQVKAEVNEKLGLT